MNIYRGTVFIIDGVEWKVEEARTIKGFYSYILQNNEGKVISIEREDLIGLLIAGECKYKR